MTARVVGPLGAVNERAALQRDAPAGCFHLVVRYDAPDRHRQRPFYPRPPFPSSVQAHVALLELESHGLAVDLERDRLLDIVLEAVEIARDGFVARPAGDANVDRKLPTLVRINGHLDVAVPGVTRLLNHLHRAAI